MIKAIVISALLALVTVVIFTITAFRYPKGTEKMQMLSRAIQEGANTFLRREFTVIALIVAIIACVFTLIGRWTEVNWKTAIAFVIGACASTLASFISMFISTRSNARTAEAARHGLKRALSISFTGGSSTGLSICGIALLGLALVWTIFKGEITAVNGYAMGASLVALFARVGGGTFTKAADMGADLVGKVEKGIPEDDPRNPAVIADNVGDNVGDVAGLGADLLESYVESIIATVAISATVGILGEKGISLPFYLAAAGLIASIIGCIIVKLAPLQDPQNNLNLGVYVASILMIISGYFITKKLGFGLKGFIPLISGLIAGLVIGWVSEFYTSNKYKPTRNLASYAQSGPAVTIVQGMALGMGSTLLPVITIVAAVFISYKLIGMYGVALASFGMLSILGITLAVDSYGPVADNAGGIAEMAGLPPEVRATTDKLDAVGNTTAAIGKGFAIGSAAFAALGLISAYISTMKKYSPDFKLSLTDPALICGLIVGGMIPFLFSSLVGSGVSKVAFKVIDEVRRQFREIPGLFEGKALPDYKTCVDIIARNALKRMILPGVIAIVMPVAIGLLLGPSSVAGLLMGALVTGLQLGIQTANTGAALDNAKKYIEEGHFGGKGTEAHKSAVIGDTFGDPLKDAMGPSLNILIKLMSIISLVLAPLFAKFL